jgi:TonB family protein
MYRGTKTDMPHMSNNKLCIMKTYSLILVLALFSSLVLAQDEVKSSESTPTKLLAPEFTGIQEDNSIIDYLKYHIRYPEAAEKWMVEGRVVIGFNVLPSGKLSDFEVIQSLIHDCDQAVITSLRSTNGMWNSGTIDGVPVAMERKVTVLFKIGENDPDKSPGLYASKLK